MSGPGHSPTASVRVLATLRRCLRKVTPWRTLIASADGASGWALRGRLKGWARGGVLPRVHALLVVMLRGNATLVLDSCSVSAKHAGELTRSSPTDRGKLGTKYHVAVTGDGVPVACLATAADVSDIVAFERLCLAAFAVMACIQTGCADKGYVGAARSGNANWYGSVGFRRGAPRLPSASDFGSNRGCRP